MNKVACLNLMSRKRLHFTIVIDNQVKDLNATSLCLNTTGRLAGTDNETLCAEGFYLDNNSSPACIPLCDFWVSGSGTTALDVIIIISQIFTVISSVILLIVALWFQRDIL